MPVVLARKSASSGGGPSPSTPSLDDVLTEGNSGGGNVIAGIADPADPQDAATKAYVDAAGINPDSIARFHGSVGRGDGHVWLPDLHMRVSVPAVHPDYGALDMNQVFPFGPTGASGAIAYFVVWTVESIDTTAGDYGIEADLRVFNEAGTEWLKVQGFGTANGGVPGDSASLGSTDLGVNDSGGTDLTYNASNGRIESAAGGTFGVMIKFRGAWN